MRKPELRKNTGDARQDFGNLTYAIAVNRHHLSNYLSSEEMIIVEANINNIVVNLYSLLCNSFQHEFDSDMIKKQIQTHADGIIKLADEILRDLKKTNKTDD